MKKKNGFTLAEVLITLVIVGVVAALTLPTLLSAINDKVRTHKITVFERKFNKGTDLLAIENGIGPYYESTEEFVNELSKHLKIIKICDNSNLGRCIPYDKIVKRNGTSVNLSSVNLTSNPRIVVKDDENNNYGETVGIVLGNGMPMLLTYNKNCPALDPDTPNQDSSSCISGLYDINGAKGPNKLGKDIIGFNGGCFMDIGTVCFTKPFTLIPGDFESCVSLRPRTNDYQCYSSGSGDFYTGAVIQCGGSNYIPTRVQLAKLASAAYKKDGKAITIGEKESVSGLKLEDPYRLLIGISLISRDKNYNNEIGYSRYFGGSSTSMKQYSRSNVNDSSNSRLKGICMSD